MRVQPLGHDPLQALGLGGGEQRRAVADVVRRRLPGRAGELQLGQPPASLHVRQLQQRVPVQPQQVEEHVDDRLGLREPAHLTLRGQVHAPLQALEARAPALVERDDLAVEHRLVRAERAAELAQLRVARA